MISIEVCIIIKMGHYTNKLMIEHQHDRKASFVFDEIQSYRTGLNFKLNLKF
jgi:hypothetical protein